MHGRQCRLVSCNVPAQILQQADGRTMISFWDTSPAQAPLILKARLASVNPHLTGKHPPAIAGPGNFHPACFFVMKR